jgi:hypothetical protein
MILKKSEANNFFVDDCVALASSIHQSRMIIDRYMATRLGDESGLLQYAYGNGNCTSPGA